MNAEKGWVIDVCATCHRLAVWPFCEHRTGKKWTVAVAVKPTPAGLSALRGNNPRAAATVHSGIASALRFGDDGWEVDYALDACDRALRLSENDRGSDGMARQVIRECRNVLARAQDEGHRHDWRAFYGRGVPGQLPDCMVCNGCGAQRPYGSDDEAVVASDDEDRP